MENTLGSAAFLWGNREMDLKEGSKWPGANCNASHSPCSASPGCSSLGVIEASPQLIKLSGLAASPDCHQSAKAMSFRDLVTFCFVGAAGIPRSDTITTLTIPSPVVRRRRGRQLSIEWGIVRIGKKRPRRPCGTHGQRNALTGLTWVVYPMLSCR